MLAAWLGSIELSALPLDHPPTGSPLWSSEVEARSEEWIARRGWLPNINAKAVHVADGWVVADADGYVSLWGSIPSVVGRERRVPLLGSGYCRQATVSGGLLFAIKGGVWAPDDFRIYDLAPNPPMVLSSIDGDFVSIAAEDTLVFLSSSWELLVYSAEHPRAPILLSTVHLGIQWSALVVFEETLYLQTGYDLEIIDLSDPHSPVLLHPRLGEHQYTRDGLSSPRPTK